MDVLDITRDLVAIDSQNPGSAESMMAAYIEEWLATAGDCTIVRHEFVPGRPNLIVTAGSGSQPHLALSGHLDTKPIGDAMPVWRTDPFQLTIVDDMAYGLGATDMKGAVAAMLVAFERYARSGSTAPVSLVLTADEEQGSNAGAQALAEHGVLDADAIVIGEPSGVERSWEMLALASRGICCFDVTVTTTQGHSGLSERLGRNAVLVAMDVLSAFESFAAPIDEPGLVPSHVTVNSGIHVSGGVAFGTSPGECTVGIEIRLVPGMSRQTVREAIRATVAEAVGDHGSFEIRFKEGSLGWMPAVELDPASAVVGAVQGAAHRVLGGELPVYSYPGGTDASYFMGRAKVPTVSSLGPGLLSVAHGPNEYVPVADLYTAVDLYTDLFHNFSSSTNLTME
jgi:succinyl-diaminopimelate desuccinylase